MSNKYARTCLERAVGQICQKIGWNAIHASTLNMMVDLLERYILRIGKSCHGYAEQAGHTTPNLDDLHYSFDDMNIDFSDLVDFVKSMESMGILQKGVPKFPVGASRNQLNIPKPNSAELLEREEHIPAYMPSMYQHSNANSNVLAEDAETPGRATAVPNGTPTRKRPNTGSEDEPADKRQRELPEEAGPSNYQLKGVFMSNTGSILGEGKLPEPQAPPPATPVTPRPRQFPSSSGFMSELANTNLFSQQVDTGDASDNLDSHVVSSTTGALLPSVTPRGRGRPRKTDSPKVSSPVVAYTYNISPRPKGQSGSPKRSPGRATSPVHNQTSTNTLTVPTKSPPKSPGVSGRSPGRPPKKSPGRPPKSPGRPPKSPKGTGLPRGRPPKNRISEEPAEVHSPNAFKEYLMTGEPLVGEKVPTKAQLKSPPTVKRSTQPFSGNTTDLKKISEDTPSKPARKSSEDGPSKLARKSSPDGPNLDTTREEEVDVMTYSSPPKLFTEPLFSSHAKQSRHEPEVVSKSKAKKKEKSKAKPASEPHKDASPAVNERLNNKPGSSKQSKKSKSKAKNKDTTEDLEVKERPHQKLLLRISNQMKSDSGGPSESEGSEDREHKKSKKKHKNKDKDREEKGKEEKKKKEKSAAAAATGALKLTLKLNNKSAYESVPSTPATSRESTPSRWQRGVSPPAANPSPLTQAEPLSPSLPASPDSRKSRSRSSSYSQPPEPDYHAPSPMPRLTTSTGRGRKGNSNTGPSMVFSQPVTPPPPVISRSPSPAPPPKPDKPPPKISPPPPPSTAKNSKKNQQPKAAVFAETQGTIIDENGEMIWICPACKLPDDGSPMIGCDSCDDWYHWPCVGITEEPPATEQWFCPKHSSLKDSPANSGSKKGAKKAAPVSKSKGKGKKKK